MTTCVRHLHVKCGVPPSSEPEKDTSRVVSSVDFWDLSLKKNGF